MWSCFSFHFRIDWRQHDLFEVSSLYDGWVHYAQARTNERQRSFRGNWFVIGEVIPSTFARQEPLWRDPLNQVRVTPSTCADPSAFGGREPLWKVRRYWVLEIGTFSSSYVFPLLYAAYSYGRRSRSTKAVLQLAETKTSLTATDHCLHHQWRRCSFLLSWLREWRTRLLFSFR